MIETSSVNTWPFLPGDYQVAGLPPAAEYREMMAYCTDSGGGCYMLSDGTRWKPITDKRIETYSGTTDASGNYTVVFPLPFATIPNVQPVTYPAADSDTRARVIAVSTIGFTIRTEKNVGLTVLTLTVLGFGTTPVPSVQVRVLVTES